MDKKEIKMDPVNFTNAEASPKLNEKKDSKFFSWLTEEKVGKIALAALVLVGAGLLAAGVGFGLPVLTGIGMGLGIGGLVFTVAYCGADFLQKLFNRTFPPAS